MLPLTYSDLLNDNIDKKAIQLVEQLSDCNSISESENILKNFSDETNSVFWVEDEYGNLVYPKGANTETELFSSDTTITFDEDIPIVSQVDSVGKSTNYYPVVLKNGDMYTLAVQVDLYVVQQTSEVLWSIFPYVIIMIFLLSLLCSALYTRYITRPIVKLSQTSREMAALDFSGKCDEGREDELGCLAKNLNYLSDALSTTMNELNDVNKQLRTDIEKERELERQRVDFFAAASHELKTPLTILKGHLNGMLNNIGGYENHVVYMERSLAVIDKMEVLVKEFLYISRADSNKDNDMYETVNLAELIRVQISGVMDLLLEKEQLLDVEIPNTILCQVICSQMERAIQNIIVNAIRYSPNGARIKITMSVIDDNVRCEIENMGVYIPDEALTHLFEAFYRSDNSHNQATGGTGLGLYIVKSVMENHQAKYGIRNTQRGVQFWFNLPQKNTQFKKSI